MKGLCKICRLSLGIKEQKGSSLILVALFLSMLIGFTAIVVDVGTLYFEKSRLQKALDSAVLGGAQLLKISEEDAKIVAVELALDNGFALSGESDIKADAKESFIEINKTVNKDLTFARIFGIKEAAVSATARAEIQGALQTGDGVIPVGIPERLYKHGGEITLSGEIISSGNFSFLALDGRGVPLLAKGIERGAITPIVVGTKVETEPGESWGKPVVTAYNNRLTKDVGNDTCLSYKTADATCNRVVIVPLIENFEGAKGRDSVLVVGFGAVWIESIGQHEVKGRFIEIVRGGSFKPGTDYGIYGVKLVN